MLLRMSGRAINPRLSSALRRAVDRPVREAADRLGYAVAPKLPPGTHAVPTDCDPFTAGLIERVGPFTMTTSEAMIGLVEAVRYLVRADVPGAFVECGVWRGGSAMLMAYTLLDLGVTDRDLHLFDTFEYVPPPGEHDYMLSGTHISEFFDETVKIKELQHLPFEDLRRAVLSTGYPPERVHFVPGLVEKTLPDHAPETLALCRLDTDLYGSTAQEMNHLWPRLSPGGVLIVDDYAQFLGAKKAVDEYFESQRVAVMLHRLDTCARLALKPG